jgi:hypothetical protein
VDNQTLQRREANFPEVLRVLKDEMTSVMAWSEDLLTTKLTSTSTGNRTIFGTIYSAIYATNRACQCVAPDACLKGGIWAKI